MREKREDGYYVGRHRGSYCAALYVGGERQSRLKIGTSDKEEATRRVRDLNIKRQRASLTGDLTIDAIFELYIADRKAAGKAAIPRMKECRALLKPRFGALLPHQISKRLVADYTEARRNLHCSNSTIRTELGYLSTVLKFAVESEFIPARPHIERPPQSRPRSHMGNYHKSREEMAILVKAAEDTPHLKTWLVLALATAGRPLHILQLTWPRVDFQRSQINLDDPERDRTAKGRALVPMNDAARAALLEARKLSSGSPYVIEWNGKPIQSIKKGLAAVAKKTGIKVSAYVIRHTAGVWMAENGTPMEEIAQIMGHTNIETTRRIYARFSPGFLQKAVSTLQVARGSEGTAVPENRNAARTKSLDGQVAQ